MGLHPTCNVRGLRRGATTPGGDAFFTTRQCDNYRKGVNPVYGGVMPKNSRNTRIKKIAIASIISCWVLVGIVLAAVAIDGNAPLWLNVVLFPVGVIEAMLRVAVIGGSILGLLFFIPIGLYYALRALHILVYGTEPDKKP